VRVHNGNDTWGPHTPAYNSEGSQW